MLSTTLPFSRAHIALCFCVCLFSLVACGDSAEGPTPAPAMTSETSETSETSTTSTTSTTSETTPTTSGPADSDEDGVADGDDNCPEDSNEDQVDLDEDGLGDACDLCPEDAGNDSDEDGVCSPIDNCPEDPNEDQEDADEDGLGDACDPLTDSDEDGIEDDGDNCPEDPNEDQADADEDGLGDVCDPCPVFPDTDTCDAQPELEPNDSPFDAGISREIPFIATGDIGDAGDGNGDLDYVRFTVEAGTALKIRLQADGASFFGAAIILGLGSENSDFARVLLNNDFNSTNEREIFLHTAGEYAVAVSDIRNLTASPEGVGADEGYAYALTVRAFEPEVRELEELPLSDLVEFDDKLHIWSIPADDAFALSLSASSSTFDPNAIHIPAFALYDPISTNVLKATGNDDVDDQTVASSVILDGSERYWFVLDMVQGFGPGVTDVQVRTLTPNGEEEPNDTEITATPLLTPGVITARIDTPQPINNVLTPDQDFFIFRAASGDVLRFDLTPAEENDFAPSLEIGGLYSWGAFDAWIISDSDGADPLQNAASISFVAPEDGVYYLRVRDFANQDISADEDPVGGLNHTYTLSSTTLPIPDERPLLTAPTQESFTYTQAGVPLFIEVAAEPGLPLELTAQNIAAGASRLTAFDAETLTPLGSVRFGALSVITPESGRVLAVTSEIRARAGDEYQVSLSAIQLTVDDVGPLPFLSETQILALPGEQDLLRFSLAEGDVIDVRLEETGADAFFPVLELHPADDLTTSFATSYSGSMVYRADSDQDFVLRISDLSTRGGPDFTYNLAIRSIDPQPLEALPTSLEVPLEETAAAGYYLLTSEEIAPIIFSQALTNAPDENYAPRMILYNWERLFQVRGTSEQSILFSTEPSTTYLLVLTEANSQSNADMTLSFQAAPLETIEVETPYAAVDTLDEAGAPLYYQLELPAESFLHAQALSTTNDSAQPSIRLYNAEGFGLIALNQPPFALSWYASEPLTAIVEILDVGVFDLLALDVSLTIQETFEESSELEPNSVLDDATEITALPARTQGSLTPLLEEGEEVPDRDWFSLSLEEGDTISLVTTAIPGGTLIDTTLTILDADGEQLVFDDDGGAGAFSRIGSFVAPETATYYVLVRPFGQGAGEYMLVVDRVP